ncbi:hypothetical protein C0991_005867 [Blastosporella zonata]|nr:hypothetical protein C0991_005867 [Blastosporella zonata]
MRLTSFIILLTLAIPSFCVSLVVQNDLDLAIDRATKYANVITAFSPIVGQGTLAQTTEIVSASQDLDLVVKKTVNDVANAGAFSVVSAAMILEKQATLVRKLGDALNALVDRKSALSTLRKAGRYSF